MNEKISPPTISMEASSADNIFMHSVADNIFMHSVRIEWNPQSDITAHELARLMPILLSPGYAMLPTEPELLRHLIVNDPNKKE